MRVAIVPTGPGAIFPAPKSHSIARIMENLIKGLQEAGHHVMLFAAASSKIDCELIPICDQPVPLYEDRDLIKTNSIQKYMLSILEKMFDSLDIIHAHSLDIPNMFHSTGLLNSLKFPNVTTCHSCIDISNVDYFKKCNNYLISTCYNQRKSFPSLKFIKNVYNGLDPTPFKFIEMPDNYLCFLGRMSIVKQPHLAIQLAIKLGIQLKMAGPIDPLFDCDYFERECRPFLSHPLIEYLGELDMKEKIELISKAKCNLHPTGFREPFGLTLIEAAYCGTPTLAIRRGSLPEIVQNWYTGILVEDYAEGYHEISKCFEMDRAYIARRARELFNYKKMTEQYISAYYDIIRLFKTHGCIV